MALLSTGWVINGTWSFFGWSITSRNGVLLAGWVRYSSIPWASVRTFLYDGESVNTIASRLLFYHWYIIARASNLIASSSDANMKYNSVGTELCCHTLVSLLVMVASLCLEEPHESLVNRKLDNQYNTRHLQWRWYHFHEFLRPWLLFSYWNNHASDQLIVWYYLPVNEITILHYNLDSNVHFVPFLYVTLKK